MHWLVQRKQWAAAAAAAPGARDSPSTPSADSPLGSKSLSGSLAKLGGSVSSFNRRDSGSVSAGSSPAAAAAAAAAAAEGLPAERV